LLILWQLPPGLLSVPFWIYANELVNSKQKSSNNTDIYFNNDNSTAWK